MKEGLYENATPIWLNDEADAEQAIEESHGRAGGHEGGGGEGDEARGDQMPERPIVSLVRPFRRWEGLRVVHGVPLGRRSQIPCHHRYTVAAKERNES